MATPSGMRIGDAEREAAAAELREHFALGRLDSAEFQERLDAVFAAKTDTDLGTITADLPGNRRRSPYDPPGSSQVRDSSHVPDWASWGYPVRFGRRRRSGAWPVILIAIVVFTALSEGGRALVSAPVPILVIATILFLAIRTIPRVRGRRHARYRNWHRP